MRPQIRRAVMAGTTAWWTNAVFARTVSPDEALQYMSGAVLVSRTAPSQPEPARGSCESGPKSAGSTRLSWFETWRRLRQGDEPALRLVLPAPGDPLGMPGPPPVTKAAIRAGAALICDGAQLALIPHDLNFWLEAATQTGLPLGGLGTISESRRAMRESMAQVTSTFADLNPDSAAVAKIADTRQAPNLIAPTGVDPRATELVRSALQVWRLMEIATEVAEANDRYVPELAPLKGIARRALAVAFSHPVSRETQ